jgi:MscS family membrane protein
MNQENIFNQIYLGNWVSHYILCAAILLVGYLFRNIIGKSTSRLIFKLFKRFSKNKFSNEFETLLKPPLKLIFELIFLYIAFYPLHLPPEWNIEIFKTKNLSFIISALFDLSLAFVITWILLRTTDFISIVMMERAQLTEDTSDDQLVGFFKELIKFAIVILALFFVLGSIFKVNIAALVTGLGLGGLAIALAAQETLSNLLASFIIFVDKPFKAGDFISVTDISGTIEKVGFRSTRIRTLDKSLLTVPNKKMVDNPLNNITESSYRRVKFTIGLLYGTTSGQLKQVCNEIGTVLSQNEMIEDGYTVKFSDYGASSLDILVIYLVKTNDWDVMMVLKEEINYKIMQIVESNGTGFAFPTRTIHIEKN